MAQCLMLLMIMQKGLPKTMLRLRRQVTYSFQCILHETSTCLAIGMRMFRAVSRYLQVSGVLTGSIEH